MLFVSSVMIGTGIKKRYKIHYTILSDLHALAQFTEREIRLKRRIYDIVEEYKVEADGVSARIFEKMIEKMRRGECDADGLYRSLSDSEKTLFARYMQLGTTAGKGDAELIRYVLSGSEEEMRNAESKLNKEGKMYFKLSVLVGIALMILVV